MTMSIVSMAPLSCRFTVHSDPRWCCTYLLDAMDPLFVEIGKAFIEQQQKGIFGPMLMKCTRTYFMPFS